MTERRYELLLQANEASLPLTVEDSKQIDQLRAYAAAGWVEASIPDPVPRPKGSWVQPPAEVLALTAAGRRMAEQAKGSRRQRQRPGGPRLIPV